MKHTLVIEFETTGDIPDLLDLVQQRVYLLDKVKKGEMRCTTLENYLWEANRRSIRLPDRHLDLPVLEMGLPARGDWVDMGYLASRAAVH